MPLLSDGTCVEIRKRFIGLGANFAEEAIVESWALEFSCSTTTISNIIYDRSYRRPECYPEGELRDAAIKRDFEWKEQKRLSRNAKARERYTTRKFRNQVLERDNYRCVYCDEDLKTTTAHIDHKVPLIDGGSQDIENLQATCPKCNRRKKAFSPNKFSHGDVGIAEYLRRRHLVDMIVEIASSTECWPKWDEWDRKEFERPFYRLCWRPEGEQWEQDHTAIFKVALEGDIERTRQLVIEHINEATKLITELQERDHWLEHAYCGEGDKWHEGECEDN